MKTINRAVQAGCFAGSLLIGACNHSDTSPTAVQNPDQSGNETEILFSETFSDSGRFTIIKDPKSGITYKVEARMGSEAEKLLATSSAQPTLTEVYRSLHGGQGDVPAIVAEVSAQLGIPVYNPTENDRHASTPAALGKGAAYADFANTYCKDITEVNYIWRWETCKWGPSARILSTSRTDPSDRVYAWNVTPYTATLSIFVGSTIPNTWRPTLQPYWVTWFQWGGTYSNAYTVMELPPPHTGEMGLSVHYPQGIVK
jgi:hypothetical protein